MIRACEEQSGAGQPVTTIAEQGERAIARGNIRADLAMLHLGYATLPSDKSATHEIRSVRIFTNFGVLR